VSLAIIRKSIEHRLSKEEVIEMLVGIGYDKNKARYLVNDYYKKRSVLNTIDADRDVGDIRNDICGVLDSLFKGNK